MELQKFVSDNKDYINLFKKDGLKVIKYKNLLLVKNYYDKPLSYTDEKDYWKMYCRGAVIDTLTNKVVCLPPVKSVEYDTIPDDSSYPGSEIQYLIDGTMINLFYHKEWIMSTRGDIGGKNKWTDKKSFKQMFGDCLNEMMDYDKLDKDSCYSFVMRHRDNRNISPIKENKLFLVEAYKFNEKEVTRVDISQINIENIENINNISFNDLVDFTSYDIKGYTIKDGNKRYKKINPLFEKIKELKPNMNNNFLNYIELRKNGNLKEYLKYFPEYSKSFDEYRNKIHNFSNELYNNYKNCYVFKNIERKDIPYHLKPLTADIHRNYLNTKEPTSWSDIKNYIHGLPSKKLMFALNYS
tara:strand:- start:97 stop:1158 length:1062 start_codon:yes stop_codon:yes gene_type:complete